MTYPTTRDLSTLYASDDDPSMVSDTQEFVRRIDTFVSTRDQPTHDRSDPEVLARALADYEPLRADYLHGSRELAYRYLRDFTDSTDVTKARLSLAQTASSQQLVRLQFFELAIGGIDPEHHPFLLTHPALAQYQHRLERLWSQARYDLSPETEKALTLTSASAYGQRVAMTDDALNQTAVTMTVDGAERSCTLEELMTLLRHTDSSTRDTAAQHIHQIMSDHEYIATRELNAILEYKKSTDYLRGFDRPDGSRIVSEDVDPAVVDALLDAVTDAYDISRDYYVLKASVLGQDTLAYHERNIPIHLSDEPLPSYTYDQACDIFSQVCATMDDRFVGIRDDMRASGRVDVYPRTGKRGGAYNISLGKNVANMIMLNYTDTLNDVTTLAHEMGHAFHTELVYRHQNALDGDYGMLTAEVSSQFLEDYVYEVLLGEMDDHQRLSLQLNTLNDMISSIHRQIACYRFEQALHQEYRDTGWIPSERIAALFAEHMAAYMGDAVTHEPGSERRWVYRSHIRSYFYVFSYAGAMLLAQTLQTQVAAGELDFSTIIDKYYTIGRNQSPAQTFETLGIDITDTATWTDGLDAIRSQLHDAQALAAQLGYTT